MAEDLVLPIPNLTVPNNLFILSSPSLARFHADASKALVEGIKADQMAPYYKSIFAATSSSTPSSSYSLPSTFKLDKALLTEMEAANKAELEGLDAKLADAEKIEGESEISDALKARAAFFARVGDKDQALPALTLAVEKTPGLGSRIDLTLTLVRVGFFFGDTELVVKHLDGAEKLINEGGDWDRRNRLKVYRALHLLSTRQFTAASALLLDALSTFTATELLAYNDFVGLCVVSGAVGVGRVELKKKIIDAPEVNQVLPEVPVLGELVKSLYECHYDRFFVALATLEQTHLLPSRLLAPHARFYVREMRVLAYTQLLESYRSLTLKSMSEAFGVGEGFVDSDLSRFIASGRLHARIDKVHGIVETTRPSLKNAQYEAVVKQGDVLLNEVQRLSKVLY
jgi:26S proteasome regulatory subunit N7